MHFYLSMRSATFTVGGPDDATPSQAVVSGGEEHEAVLLEAGHAPHPPPRSLLVELESKIRTMPRVMVLQKVPVMYAKRNCDC